MYQSIQNIGKEAAGGIEVFVYPPTSEPPAPSWVLWNCDDVETNEDDSLSAAGCQASIPPAEVNKHAGCEARLAEEVQRSFEAGRERGLQEGRAAERDAQSAHGRAREQLRIEETARLMEDFHGERSRYFEAVEHEVVKLALAVAARILRREAQMDPLLLTGAVRVALGQLSQSTQVRLRVPPAEMELWADTIAALPNLAQKPAVLSGEGMRLGDCVIETELGSVDLGVRAQLGEIEHGFFDRAGRNSVSMSAQAAKVSEDMSE